LARGEDVVEGGETCRDVWERGQRGEGDRSWGRSGSRRGLEATEGHAGLVMVGKGEGRGDSHFISLFCDGAPTDHHLVQPLDSLARHGYLHVHIPFINL
jgi:hypothetical protein